MVKRKEQENEQETRLFKLGIEKVEGLQSLKKGGGWTNVPSDYSESEYDADIRNQGVVRSEERDYLGEIIAENNAKIAYLKTRQKEQAEEIKEREEKRKRLEQERKANKLAEKERQKLYNLLNEGEEIGLTRINGVDKKGNKIEIKIAQTEPLISKKQKEQVAQYEKNRLKNEYRASLFYPDDTEETKLYLAKQKQVAEKQRQEQKAQLEKQVDARNNAKTLPISDVEKTLFPNGNLAEMDFPKSKELGEGIVLKNQQNESIKNEVLSQGNMRNIINEINVIIDELDDFASSLKKDLFFYFKNIDMDNEVVNSYIDKKIFSYIFPGQFIKPLLIWWSTTSMLDKFYKSSEVNLSNSKDDLKIKNSMRHITGLARVAKAFSPRDAVFYGAMKEALDIFRELKEQKGKIRQEIWDDVRSDFSNNSVGIDFIKNNPNATNDEIMQFAYEHSKHKLNE